MTVKRARKSDFLNGFLRHYSEFGVISAHKLLMTASVTSSKIKLFISVT